MVEVVDPLLLELARCLEGPRRPVPSGSRFSLDELRAVRWSQLSEQERGVRIDEARAVFRHFGYIHNKAYDNVLMWLDTHVDDMIPVDEMTKAIAEMRTEPSL